jgi:hypothetical protein
MEDDGSKDLSTNAAHVENKAIPRAPRSNGDIQIIDRQNVDFI